DPSELAVRVRLQRAGNSSGGAWLAEPGDCRGSDGAKLGISGDQFPASAALETVTGALNPSPRRTIDANDHLVGLGDDLHRLRTQRSGCPAQAERRRQRGSIA